MMVNANQGIIGEQCTMNDENEKKLSQQNEGWHYDTLL